ncbi:Noc2p family-domain-containing protein [Radiomyces spectabilis]|uniref:Noc2p family-domain-containing protein n=1 Tax=Radiomyces spectabilis TaxID=64574 RepID=UPI00221FA1DA|nr:Noc2p family-domain-containing protein [Radiomyces spectabilis]KAI8379325.1 Noc2p family-domain-containing protein [Radiomyces spectabilis]
MAKAKKATIKFQKNKLKQTVERRKKNTKFKQQVARRQARRNRGPDKTAASAEPKGETAEQKDSEETTDDQGDVSAFFAGYVLDPEESLDLNNDIEADLNALDQFTAVVDDEIMETDEVKAETNDAQPESEDDEEEDDEDMEEEEEELMESNDELEDDESEEDDDANGEIVTMDMFRNWSREADQKSPQALKRLLLAFRAIARSDEDIEEPSQHIVLSKKHNHPSKTKYWPKIAPVVELYLNNATRLLKDFDQDDMIQWAVSHLQPLATYFGYFQKASTEYLRVLLDRWADTTLSSETRQKVYQTIRDFAATAIDAEKKSYLGHVLKGSYLVFARRAVKINAASLPVVQQMLEEAADFYTIDTKNSAVHAQVYVRQLATHLKNAKKASTIDSFKAIYTWQFINCLEFWGNVLSVTCDPVSGAQSPMQAIVYPLIEVALHTLRLNPTAQFLPLRIHILKMLTNIIDATGYYIPLAPHLFEIFGNDIFKSQPDVASLEPFDWDLHLKTPKEYMHTKVYQDAVFKAVYDGLVDFYACFGLSVAFPELAIPAIDKVTYSRGECSKKVRY